MKPLIILIVVFVIALVAGKIILGYPDFALSGRIAMSAMLVFTAVGHAAFTKGMAMMLPEFIPNKTAMIYLTGVVEALAAIGLLIPGLRIVTGWLLILFFLLILPANVYAAMHHIDYQAGNYQGNGKSYLWFRAPLQFFFIAWVYFSATR